MPEVFEFGDLRLDLRTLTLSRAGNPVPLEPKTFDVLRYLVEHRDRVVTKEELLDSVWKDTFVTPNVLTRAIAQLRKSLGDAVDDFERDIIVEALLNTDFNQTRAADMLGTTRRILKYRMDKLGIDAPDR